MTHDRLQLAGALATIAAEVAGGAPIDDELRARIRNLANAIPLSLEAQGPPGPPVASARVDPHREPARRLFGLWQVLLEHPKAKPTPERITAIRSRLRDGYTEADLADALRALAASPYHRGENDQKVAYDDLTFVFRTGSQVERFRDRFRENTAEELHATGAPDEQNPTAIKAAMRAALQSNDHAAYKRLNDALRARLKET